MLYTLREMFLPIKRYECALYSQHLKCQIGFSWKAETIYCLTFVWSKSVVGIKSSKSGNDGNKVPYFELKEYFFDGDFGHACKF